VRRRPVIRHPRADESLTALFPALEKFHWNLEQVYVAELDDTLVGGLIVWDAGHDVVHANNLVVLPEYVKDGVAYALMYGVRADLAAKGKKAMIGETTRFDMAYWCQKRGAQVSGPYFMIGWAMP
jgi:GNAT superfamily N-acetyltransferase